MLIESPRARVELELSLRLSSEGVSTKSQEAGVWNLVRNPNMVQWQLEDRYDTAQFILVLSIQRHCGRPPSSLQTRNKKRSSVLGICGSAAALLSSSSGAGTRVGPVLGRIHTQPPRGLR
jgi:hypothetical protein